MCIRDSNESERECAEILGVQRADFPQVYCEMEGSQVFYEDRVSSKSYVEDEVSSYGPLVFCDLPGKDRRGNKCFVVPFAWNEIVQGGCEKYCERERIIAVSYTHLDVYKRQGMTSELRIYI